MLQSLSSWGRRRVTLQAPHIAHLYQLKAPTILNAQAGWRGHDFPANQLLQEGLPAFVAIEKNNTASGSSMSSWGFERQIEMHGLELLFTEAANQDYLE
ncbi:hypothetical protein GWK47_022054 [Chionoecetes opilio]|uniref:Uncharacterized protein n=1 Tax=Chionoecetes opilio TaxID=41210 RepID=A0A8J4XNI0_CHIOP|nr:hypothetical protein GWK47_022054 [Chionoecetes opilio]